MSKNTSIELFDFNAEHNGEKCIKSLRPEDQGTRRQYLFTIALFAACFQVGVDTIRRRVQILIDTGDLNETQNCVSLNIPNQNGNGATKTTLYDLEVFNKLAMTFIDNPRAVQIRNAFSDVLVKHETGTEQYNIPRNYPDALRALANAIELGVQREAERDEAVKEREQAILERNKALVEKKRINEKRIATACATAAKFAIRCQKLEKEIDELIGQKRFPFWDGNLKLV